MDDRKKPTAYEKRLKRQISGRSRDFFISVAPGLETACLSELNRCCPEAVLHEPETGGIGFTGRLTDLYSASLHLTMASRILMRITSFTATAFHQMEKAIAGIPWPLYYRCHHLPLVRVSTRSSRLYHSDAIAERIRRVIEIQLAAASDTDPDFCAASPEAPGDGSPAPVPELFVRVQNDRFTVSIDSSGDLLYKRGVKTRGGDAPIRETLAAMILSRAGFAPGVHLLDPMCGSGTFSIEAAFRVCNIPAGRYRRFAFESWPAFSPRQWQYLLRQADDNATLPDHPTIFASDLNPEAVTALETTLAGFPFARAVAMSNRDIFTLTAADLPAPGLIVLNPPYGRRLSPSGDTTEISDFYNRLVRHLETAFQGHRIAMIHPPDLPPVRFSGRIQKSRLRHGGLDLHLITGRLTGGKNRKIRR